MLSSALEEATHAEAARIECSCGGICKVAGGTASSEVEVVDVEDLSPWPGAAWAYRWTEPAPARLMVTWSGLTHEVDAEGRPLARAQALPEDEGEQPQDVSRMGYVDEAGAMVIPPTYLHAEPFCQGRAAVQIWNAEGDAELWINLDTDGQPVPEAP